MMHILSCAETYPDMQRVATSIKLIRSNIGIFEKNVRLLHFSKRQHHQWKSYLLNSLYSIPSVHKKNTDRIFELFANCYVMRKPCVLKQLSIDDVII